MTNINLKNIKRLYLISIKNLVRYKVNIILMIAILISCQTMTVSLGYNSGLKNQLNSLMKTLYTGDYTITSKKAKLSNDPHPMQLNWDDVMISSANEIKDIESIPGVEYVSKRLVLTASAYGEDDELNEYISVIGCDLNKEFDELSQRLLRFNGEFHLDKKNNDRAFISKDTADRLKVKVGDSLYLFYIDEYGMLTPTIYNVNGIFQSAGFPEIVESLIFVDQSSIINNLKSNKDYVTYYKVVTDNTNDLIGNIQTKLAETLIDRSIFTANESGSFIQSIVTGISFLTNISNSILYISIFLFAFSSLFIAVHNRKREIGIMSSMGFSRKEIMSLLLIEGALLGLVPAIIGGAIGLIITGVLTFVGIPAMNDAMKYMFASDYLYFSFNLSGVFIITIVVTFMTILGSIPPALKITKIKPVEVLR